MKSRRETMTDYARLAVRVGVNLQRGQQLLVNCLVEHSEFARVVTAEAYAAGASYVDVYFTDQRFRRAQAENGPEDGLDWSPPWLVQRLNDANRDGAALLAIVGNPEPGVFAGVDGVRLGRTRMKAVAEAGMALTDEGCNWSVVAFPNEGWATTVLGEPDVDRLWEAVAIAVRLDEPDPVEAWREHTGRLSRRAAALNEHRFEVLRYRGPGTDLTVGLHPDSTWLAALDLSKGVEHVPNMPTEEVFTVPDSRRVDGTVSATYPLDLTGTLVRGLRVRFENGLATEVDADEGEDVIRTHLAGDDGGRRLGEVALVDRTSRVGQTGLVFCNTLFDENAASHLAFGAAILSAIERSETMTPEERHEAGVNQSNIHTDFMIGSAELDVYGVTGEGREVPILIHGDWVLEPPL